MRIARDRIELLQWLGLFGAGIAWTVQLVLGLFVTYARCGAAASRAGIDLRAWELALGALALACVLVSSAAAISVLLETRGVEDSDPPPDGRRHFFAVGAVLGNALFLVIVVLSTFGSVYFQPCGGA